MSKWHFALVQSVITKKMKEQLNKRVSRVTLKQFQQRHNKTFSNHFSPYKKCHSCNMLCVCIFQMLENMFSKYGKVISTRILRDKDTNSKGVGFARYVPFLSCLGGEGLTLYHLIFTSLNFHEFRDLKIIVKIGCRENKVTQKSPLKITKSKSI